MIGELHLFPVDPGKILGSPSLSADFDVLDLRTPGRTDLKHVEHSVDHRLKMTRIDARVFGTCVFFVLNGAVTDFLQDMGRVVISPVGNGCGHIGQLYRGGQDLALADRV